LPGTPRTDSSERISPLRRDGVGLKHLRSLLHTVEGGPSSPPRQQWRRWAPRSPWGPCRLSDQVTEMVTGLLHGPGSTSPIPLPLKEYLLRESSPRMTLLLYPCEERERSQGIQAKQPGNANGNRHSFPFPGLVTNRCRDNGCAGAHLAFALVCLFRANSGVKTAKDPGGCCGLLKNPPV
jgi:hypothetical protein